MITRNTKYIFWIIGLVIVLVIGIGYFVMTTSQELGCGTSSLPEEQYATIDHEGRIIFEENCSVCHRVRLEFVGPALIHLTEKRDSLWIRQMITNGMQLIESGVSTANQLFQEYGGIIHPSFSHLPESTIEKIIEFIKLESANASIVND